MAGAAVSRGAMINRQSLRVSSILLFIGQLLYIVVTQFHADGTANDHRSVFSEYAHSTSWKGVHVAQFASAAVLLAGLIALYYALDGKGGATRWLGRFGAASAVVALALYGMLQAVDGVGNKQVDAAWVDARSTDKAARFASAEAMRWLEWGARSYFDFTLGLALILLGVAIALNTGIPRPIGYLMGLSGVAYFAQGAVVGSDGFSGTHDALIVVAWVLSAAWIIWLLIFAVRLRDSRPLEMTA